MQFAFLFLHIVIVLFLIVVVLLQRSEGGALGIGGGGGGGGGLMTGRGAATALQKVTWGLAIAFIVSSIFLALYNRQRAEDASVADTTTPAGIETGLDPAAPVLPNFQGAPDLDPLAPRLPTPAEGGGGE